MRLLTSRAFLWSVTPLSCLGILVLLNNFLYFAWLTAAPPVASPSGGRPMTTAEVDAARRAANWALASTGTLVILGASAAIRAVRLGKKKNAG